MKVAKLLAWVHDSVHRRLIRFSQDRLCCSAFSYHDQALHNTLILIQDLRDRIQPLLGSLVSLNPHIPNPLWLTRDPILNAKKVIHN